MGKKHSRKYPINDHKNGQTNGYSHPASGSPDAAPKAAKSAAKNDGTFLGIDVKQLAMALAGVIIAELAEALADQLVQRLSGKRPSTVAAEGIDNLSEDMGMDRPGSQADHPIRTAVSNLGDQLQEAGPVLGGAAAAVKSSLGDFSPNFDEIVEVIREVGQNIKEKSVGSSRPSPTAVMEHVSDSARTAATAVSVKAATTNLGKSKKKGKKKKKK